MADDDRLTIRDVVALCTIMRAVSGTCRVQWLLDGSEHVVEGVARAITRDGGGFINGDTTDVRDAFVHVSGMIEQWLPIRDVMRMIHEGRFVISLTP